MAEPEDLANLDAGALQARIDVARRGYRDARDGIVPAVAGLLAHPEAAADALLEAAEEFGAEHAVETLRADTAGFGDRRDETPISEEAAQYLTEAIEAMLEVRDQLDRLTGERERRRLAADPSHARVVNVDGREFEVVAEELRSVDTPAESHPMGVAIPTRELTLTEHARYASGAEPAQPDRDRSRSRIR